MSPMRLLLLAALFFTSLAGAVALDVPAPTAASVQANLDGLAGRKLAEPEHKALQQSLEQTLNWLTSSENSKKRLADLKQQLKGAPQTIAEAQRELDSLRASPPTDIARQYTEASVSRLERLLTQRSTQLVDWQQALAEANSLVLTAQTRPERAQSEISRNQTRGQQINLLLKNAKEAGKPLSPERRDQLAAELYALDATNQLLREELSGNSLLLDLGTSQHDLYSERIARAEQESLDLQTLISEKRRVQSQQTVDELARDLPKAGTDKRVADLSSANLELSNRLLKYTDELNSLTRENLRTRRQLDSLDQSERSLEEQSNVLQGSLLLAKILYQQKQALPQVRPDRDLTDRIADLRLYQFEINRQREQLASPASYVEQLLADQPEDSIRADERQTLLELAQTRSELLERLSHELNALLNEAINLQLNQSQLQQLTRSISAGLDEQLFWIPSNRPLDAGWLRNMPHLLKQQVASLHWGASLRELGTGLVERPLVFLPLLLLIALLLWKRRFLRNKLRGLHADIGHIRRDSQLHTPRAVFLNVLLAVPVALFLALCGYALQLDGRGQNAALGAALYEMAKAWLVFYTAYRILTPGGVAVTHFRWAPTQVAFLRREIRWLGLVVMALIAVVTVAGLQPGTLAEDVLGIAVVMICYLLLTSVLARLLLKGPEANHAPPVRLAIGLLFAALPVGLILTVSFGYYYTALKLSDRLVDTLYVLLFWVLLEALFVRGLNVAARRLAYQRSLAERENHARDGGESGELLETHALDMEQVNQQSLRLVRLTLFSGLLVALYWVWADLISVFSYLDNITLYQFVASSGEVNPISLGDLLAALLIVAITTVLARNLPGLLEVLVLSRLRLAQGSVYATTTLLSYVLIGIGFVSTLSTLGVAWEKLQWLVAALSVGIGFGMQEIFANFISGLILLFERPVRIGDLVTIGNVTGTVKRIRIRATHLIDGDRKEVIVPNRILVTSQLINWTLSDTVTRIVLSFQVNRGADLELAKRLLLQAASENPRVMRDPGPSVQLTVYQPGSLGHDLKFYVRELGDRGLATDEVNRRVDQLFADHGINLAGTPKMDIVLSRASVKAPALSNDQTAADGPQPDASA
jgi:potassium efflux system protein